MPELLVVWRANIEGSSLVHFEFVMKYFLKYMIKAGFKYDPFSSFCGAIIIM